MSLSDHGFNVLLLLVGCGLCLLAVSGCGQPETGGPSKSTAIGLLQPRQASLPDGPDDRLRHGRSVWLQTCQRCHGPGLEGAPEIRDASAWQQRLAGGRERLHRHALEGFIAASGAEMPARGGDRDLEDAAVIAAADYMIWVATGQLPAATTTP